METSQTITGILDLWKVNQLYTIFGGMFILYIYTKVPDHSAAEHFRDSVLVSMSFSLQCLATELKTVESAGN